MCAEYVKLGRCSFSVSVLISNNVYYKCLTINKMSWKSGQCVTCNGSFPRTFSVRGHESWRNDLWPFFDHWNICLKYPEHFSSEVPGFDQRHLQLEEGKNAKLDLVGQPDLAKDRPLQGRLLPQRALRPVLPRQRPLHDIVKTWMNHLVAMTASYSKFNNWLSL